MARENLVTDRSIKWKGQHHFFPESGLRTNAGVEPWRSRCPPSAGLLYPGAKGINHFRSCVHNPFFTNCTFAVYG